MQDIKIDGTGIIESGKYGVIEIDGSGKCTGDLQAESIKVDGLFRCAGSIQTGRLDCDGMVKIAGNIQAKSIDIDGYLKVSGGTRIEADEIRCDGMIRLEGEVSADVILADGFICAKEIVGETVRIKSKAGRFLRLFWGKRSRIPLIEATTIELQGVVADTVNGKDITIGRDCRIERVDCSGTLSVGRGARIGEISGGYKMREG